MKTYKMEINGEKFEGRVIEYDGMNAKIDINGIIYTVKMEPEFGKSKEQFKRPEKVITKPPSIEEESKEKKENLGEIKAPLPGVIFDIKVKEGDKVNIDDVIIILEAMKMQSEIPTLKKGIVKSIKVKKGETVQEDQILAEIKDKDE